MGIGESVKKFSCRKCGGIHILSEPVILPVGCAVIFYCIGCLPMATHFNGVPISSEDDDGTKMAGDMK